MDKLKLISTISKLYNNGQNIIQYLKDLEGRTSNSIEDILISYDFQAGSYIKYANDNPSYLSNYSDALAKTINNLVTQGTVLEAGVGEATTLASVATRLSNGFVFGGFDISWSRIFYGKKYLADREIEGSLFTADLFNMPLADNSVDIVYTSHSLEPNGGREEQALKELFRVATKYLILLEPGYEFASEEGRERMRRNGYVRNLKGIIESLRYNLIEYRQFDFSSNPLNPTALYVIEKNANAPIGQKLEVVCPISGSILIERTDHLFAPDALISYPKIMGIPCLTANNAILTTKMI